MLLLTFFMFEDNWYWLLPLTVCTRCSLMRNSSNTRMLTNILMCRQTIPALIPVQEGTRLFGLLCLLMTFQCGFLTAGVAEVSIEGGGGRVWGSSLSGRVLKAHYSLKCLVCLPQCISHMALRYVQTCLWKLSHRGTLVLITHAKGDLILPD